MPVQPCLALASRALLFCLLCSSSVVYASRDYANLEDQQFTVTAKCYGRSVVAKYGWKDRKLSLQIHAIEVEGKNLRSEDMVLLNNQFEETLGLSTVNLSGCRRVHENEVIYNFRLSSVQPAPWIRRLPIVKNFYVFRGTAYLDERALPSS